MGTPRIPFLGFGAPLLLPSPSLLLLSLRSLALCFRPLLLGLFADLGGRAVGAGCVASWCSRRDWRVVGFGRSFVAGFGRERARGQGEEVGRGWG